MDEIVNSRKEQKEAKRKLEEDTQTNNDCCNCIEGCAFGENVYCSQERKSSMKIFLAMPYSQFTGDDYIVMPKYKALFERLLEGIESKGHEVFLAARRENWGKSYDNEKESTKIDHDRITTADLVLMVPAGPSKDAVMGLMKDGSPSNVFSGGTHVEAGWASTHKRKIKMFLQKGAFYSPMITGLGVLTYVEYFYYDDFDESLVDLMIGVARW